MTSEISFISSHSSVAVNENLKRDVLTGTVGGLMGNIRKWPLEVTLKRAQEFAGAVVEINGATSSDRSFYTQFTDKWLL